MKASRHMQSTQGMFLDHQALVARIAYISVSHEAVTIKEIVLGGYYPRALHKQHADAHTPVFL